MHLQLQTKTAQLARSQERMIEAAVRLFARSGFNGVTTKEIARAAKVSEGNIFRYFPTKRGLYAAALESELRRLRIQAESLARIANEPDANAALRALFELIIEMVSTNPNAVRLLQFSVLEFGDVMSPVYRRHLGAMVEAATTHMQCWSHECRLQSLDPLATVLSFVATVVTLQSYYPLFSGDSEKSECGAPAAATYADLWLSLLAPDRKLRGPGLSETPAISTTE